MAVRRGEKTAALRRKRKHRWKKGIGRMGPRQETKDKKNVPLLEPKILRGTLWELRLHRCSGDSLTSLHPFLTLGLKNDNNSLDLLVHCKWGDLRVSERDIF
ncbi:hypothetical protein NC652_000805 [Populus alba x Populus x berolinensis]|uniref:Uncharacterized protein n=1 Tax=Populus alba x Populus x berolinensis TaxID=444605 RepID=A0AAD6WET5_9ROSI|nr:hypothetical protein NC652_000805 [Populus alba x Populus x berolinensis]KAJ7010208.1 hypothetical protein NC653_000828 [Populus alba x Populus x berolinensis]